MDRKPSVALYPEPETKEPYVLRLEPRDIARLKELGRQRGLGHSTNARLLLLHALRMAEIEDAMKMDRRMTGV
jgi:hypothetical protein